MRRGLPNVVKLTLDLTADDEVRIRESAVRAGVRGNCSLALLPRPYRFGRGCLGCPVAALHDVEIWPECHILVGQ